MMPIHNRHHFFNELSVSSLVKPSFIFMLSDKQHVQVKQNGSESSKHESLMSPSPWRLGKWFRNSQSERSQRSQINKKSSFQQNCEQRSFKWQVVNSKTIWLQWHIQCCARRMVDLSETQFLDLRRPSELLFLHTTEKQRKKRWLMRTSRTAATSGQHSGSQRLPVGSVSIGTRATA